MNADLALGLLLGLIDRATMISDKIRQAKAEGRDLTSEELDELVADDDQARDDLKAEIARQKAGGQG